MAYVCGLRTFTIVTLNGNRKSCAFYRTATFPMTLSDLWRSFRWPTCMSLLCKNVLLTRDLLAIAKFLVVCCVSWLLTAGRNDSWTTTSGAELLHSSTVCITTGLAYYLLCITCQNIISLDTCTRWATKTYCQSRHSCLESPPHSLVRIFSASKFIQAFGHRIA